MIMTNIYVALGNTDIKTDDDLIIEYDGHVVYRGADVFRIDTSLPINEFWDKLKDFCKNEGFTYSEFIEEFSTVDSIIESVNENSFNPSLFKIFNEKHDFPKIKEFLNL
jgi:hypothetical protein